MNLFKSVKTKLIFAFIVVAIIIGIVGSVGGISLRNVNAKAGDMYDVNLQSVNEVLSLKANFNKIRAEVLVIINEKDSARVTEARGSILALVSEDNKYMADYEKKTFTQKEKEIWDKVKSDITKCRDIRNEVIKSVDDGEFNKAKDKYELMISVEREVLSGINDVAKINLSNAQIARENIDSTYKIVNIIMIAVSIFGFGVAILLGFLMARDVNKPLGKIKDYAERLALYDFSTPITITRKDEFGQTGIALNKAQENVNNLIREIMENSQDISAASEELSATAEELTAQAANIEQAVDNIADSMQESSAASEEITASVEEVNSSINELSGKAVEGSDNANKSKERAKDVQINSKKALDETKELYSEKENNMLQVIENGKVVDNIKIMADTIGSIAEQTNLLALNAAIEAARAGEQGKGFAVVAEEVRTLAEQSAQAVTAIQDTINKVQQAFNNSINTGKDILAFIDNDVNNQFNDYAETGNQYYNDSDFVSKMSEEIAAMSEEISATVGQVNEVVQNMAEAAQKSSEQAGSIKENMHETTKAIEQVSETAQSQAVLAQKLNEMVQKFKI